jgi:hypothetical protein
VTRASDHALTAAHPRSRWSSIAFNAILIVAALAIAVAALMGRPDAKQDTPTLEVMNRSGDVVIQNSLEGQPIISVGNTKPGQMASGQVTLKNTGTARGIFYLAPLDLVSPVGPGGARLSHNLIVRVTLTKGGATSRKFRGLLSKMGARTTAGGFSPGQSGTYTFQVQAVNTGIPARPTRSRPVQGDNKYQGTSAAVTFGWSTSPN